jgi:hypothetical protein
MKKYSAEDLKNIKPFNTKSCVGKYKVKTSMGQIVIDNVEGRGHNSATKEVFIKGFLAVINHDTFKNLYESFEEDALPSSPVDLPQLVEGKALANPIIFYDVEPFFNSKTKGPKIVGFDNVDNAAALINAGSDILPVQVVLVGYSGSVKRSDAIFKSWCGRNVDSNNNVVKDPYIQLIFK